MRHIAINTFQPSLEWQQRASEAKAGLLAKQTWDEKLKYMKQHSQIWRDLGAELIQHFGHKCWYTDSASYGARLDVEHFRPKAKTLDIPIEDLEEAGDELLQKFPDSKRDGYWWLAFDAENLLLCAQVMNREEKRNFFPLHRDSPVASVANQNLWRSEIPAFLDPRKPADVCLVTYDDNGAMRPGADVEGWDRLRVLITNECFGLSRYQPLTEGRQRVWQRCTDLMEQYLQAAKKQLVEGLPSPVLEQEKNDALLSLRRMLDPSEPFSSVAASCLLNSPYKWANVLATL
jgi:hypothetical protein